MIIKIQKGENVQEIQLQNYEVGFYGEELDDRGKQAVNLLKERCQKTVQLKYMSDDFTIMFDEQEVQIHDLPSKLEEYTKSNSLLDGTTLGFGEIALLTRELLNKNELSFLYVEPGKYYRPKSKNLLHKRDFELSGKIGGFKAIPGFSALLTDDIAHKVVFILGFESARVEKAFEDHQMINRKGCDLIFGFPAFNAGWEMNSFANHIKLIDHYNLIGDVKFGAATDPHSTYSIIKKINEAIDEDVQLFLSPLGTKPMAIGCALFAAEHPETAVLYDHPEKKAGRSSDTNIWHLYEVENE